MRLIRNTALRQGMAAVAALLLATALPAAAEPARTVVAYPMPGASAVLAATNRAETLVGAHEQALIALRLSPLRARYAAALTVPSAMIGENFRPNIEELLRVRPDAVLQWADRGAGLIEPIERLGLPVIGFRYGTEADARANIAALGAALGEDDRAAATLAWRDRIEAGIAAVRGGLDAAAPGVLYLPRIVTHFQAGGADNYINEALAIAGGTNVAGALPGDPILGPEQILTLAPDVILIGSFDPAASAAMILDDPRLAAVPAVRTGRVHRIPVGGYRWDPPSQESPLFWLWLAARLHPQADWPDLATQTQAALSLLYDLDIDLATARQIAEGQWR